MCCLRLWSSNIDTVPELLSIIVGIGCIVIRRRHKKNAPEGALSYLNYESLIHNFIPQSPLLDPPVNHIPQLVNVLPYRANLFCMHVYLRS